MHIYFSGIGGTAIGPLALISKQAGYEVSGSDANHTQYIDYLKKGGVNDVHIGQTREAIAEVHARKLIDWFVYTSALPITNPDHPELVFCKDNHIRTSKRDELLNEILTQKHLKLMAIAGTHGKTTTTAMAIWLFKQLDLPVSYSLGAKINFGDMGHYEPSSEYFVYECDEFDRNFLAFHPHLSIISGVAWDHHEIFPTKENYNQAFGDFLNQSQKAVLWQEDAKNLGLPEADTKLTIESYENLQITDIKLAGLYNRRDAWLVVKAVGLLTGEPQEKLIQLMNDFPGVSRRFEKLADNLYTDYAHTPEKITGAMSVALETLEKMSGRPRAQVLMESKETSSNASEPYQAYGEREAQKITPESAKPGLVVIYEPLTNRRMHYMKDQHCGIFTGVDTLYWVPSYLAREDPSQTILSPAQLIEYLDDKTKALAKPMKLDENLRKTIETHLKNGDLVLALSGGSAGSLDDWLRRNFTG
ncbi:hypothetical protein COU91_02645 [Candidatus Saccharibacteria bacterium CG10_big_fil_rev_8_21_14_0_10_47_8]|nr:MAG: hypothetical protein COU91_02645 [Candidatus Saccharibacteria bacterium CG10_big_fil_rev_8_21_14_0_10_47_8]